MKHLKFDKKHNIDPNLAMVAVCEKRMRGLIKIIKEKRKILNVQGRKYQAIENSYNRSLQELDEYTKQRDKFLSLVRKTFEGAV